MGLCERIVREREEEERRRGRTYRRSENTLSTVFAGRPESASGDRSHDQRRTDLRRYFTYGVHSRFEAMYLAHLRRRYPDEYWDLRYGRL